MQPKLLSGWLVFPSYTHSIIRSLRQFDRFTDKQINDIVNAAISNNQIYWISDNPPIRRFMQEIYNDFIDIIEEEYIEDFVKRYNLTTPE